MGNQATACLLAAVVLGAAGLRAQALTSWRHVGNTVIDRSLAGLAGGPVDRAAYSPDGSRLIIRTGSGHVFVTADLENWQPADDAALQAPDATAAIPEKLPEPGAVARIQSAGSSRIYAFGRFAYGSDDGGSTWDNLTGFRGASIVGAELRDLAVSPRNPDEIVAAGASGLFHSLDGGKSWSSLNPGIANLPAFRLLGLPEGDRGVRLELRDASVIEWEPGRREAWQPVSGSEPMREQQMRAGVAFQRGAAVSAVESSGGFIYAGMAGGRIDVSSDGGLTWRTSPAEDGAAVERFWVDPSDPRVALAILSRPGAMNARVIRTQNGGAFWDDMTLNLPAAEAYGITADRHTGAVYVATGRGVFQTSVDLGVLGPAQAWTEVPGLPRAAVMDVKLDAQGHQLWAALDGFGVYATLAPHRLRDPQVVSAADLVARAAAPGSLVSVLGARVEAARAGDAVAPVLATGDTESQIQIPFEARGSSVALAVETAGGPARLPPVPLRPAAPAILVDRDGSPMLLDADSGVMLDAMTPARSRGRVQIIATGLGRVRPDWPTGLAAPVENPPQVAANVTAYLDREPVQVTRAVLAPYIGFYLVEIEVPRLVNAGPAELFIEVDGQASNRVRIYLEP